MAYQREAVTLTKPNIKVHINKLSMADEERFDERYGLDKLREAFKLQDHKRDFDTILAVMWEMLDSDDRSKLSKIKVMVPDGLQEKQLETDDPVVLLKHLISGADELQSITFAIMRTFIKSRPDVKETTEKKQMGE